MLRVVKMYYKNLSLYGPDVDIGAKGLPRKKKLIRKPITKVKLELIINGKTAARS